MKLPPIVFVGIALGVAWMAIGAFVCPTKYDGRETTSANVVVEGGMTPGSVRVGDPHTLSVDVTNSGTRALEITGVDVTRTLPDGRTAEWRLGGWNGGLRQSRVPAGETLTVFSRSGRNCGDAGNYNVNVVVHTTAGDFADSFVYRFTE